MKYVMQGNSLSVHIEWELNHYSWIGGNSERGDSYEIKYWYEGFGKVTISPTEEITFRVQTSPVRDKMNNTFEKELFRTHGVTLHTQVIEEKAVHDLFLHQLVLLIRENKSNEIIPVVQEVVLEGIELIHAGYLHEPGYQLVLQF